MRNFMKHSLKTRLSLYIALVALLTVALISILSNIFINRQFKDYVVKQQDRKTEELLSNLNRQYDGGADAWNVDFLHAIGMTALYEGYIVKVYDQEGGMVWDAEACDMSACSQVMSEISQKMRARYPDIDGEFTSKKFALTQENRVVGSVQLAYFAPYFFSENDFYFLDALNTVFVACGAFSLLLAATVGWLIARQVSDPVRKAAAVAKRISSGDYVVRMEDRSDIEELDELTRSVNHLASSLGAQENLRKRLTADVAHELRTPLTTLGTHIEAMIEGVWDPTPERLSSCHEEVQRIGKLVRDLESLAKADSDNLKLEKTSVDLRELVEKSLRSFEAEIENKNLHASVAGNCPKVLADGDRIGQVLTNLLSNAVKYTPAGGTVRVLLSEGDNSSFLVVEDDGVGIPQEEQPFIFERFYRADKSRNRTTGGSGIGLAIVRSIVAKHGGKVGVSSRPGQGARFQVELPW
jgi:heavy metal sensor kinase